MNFFYTNSEIFNEWRQDNLMIIMKNIMNFFAFYCPLASKLVI